LLKENRQTVLSLMEGSRNS